MNTRTKEILRTSINSYNTLPDKQGSVDIVKENLILHYHSLDTIGIGLDADKVRAGEIFLRLVKNKQ